MGSSDFGVPSLDRLVKEGYIISAIVSTPAKPKGRGLKLEDSPIVTYAKKNKLGPIFTPQDLSSSEFIENLKNIMADLYIVVAFRLLPEVIFNIPLMGTYNLHASILPKYRGPAPIQRAIENGEKETGITIFRIDAGIDTGDIILIKKTNIGEYETSIELSKRLSVLGADGIIEAIKLIESGKARFFPQNKALASPAPKLKKYEGKICWEEDAIKIFNKIRAYKPFPGTYSYLNNSRINIEWALPQDCEKNKNVNAGTVLEINSNGINVKCGKGILRILKVKPEGKREMSFIDFVNGRNIKIGDRFS
jgi:methionyl-tRNA formyltransferase